MANEAGYALGIDLGTTYSAAAVARGGTVEVCTLGTTAAQIPSVVVLRDDGEILTGEAADRRAVSEPARTAREFKRRLGDPVPIIVGGTPYGAEALMAHLLRAIVDQVTEREGSAPAVTVLTHPANYSEYKMGLLREAARLAGLDLNHVLLVPEPEAAAISYANQQRVGPTDVVAVYDFGGGTFDAAVVRKSEHGFELLGTPEGMERLGGIDIDQAVLAHVDAVLGELVSSADPSEPTVRASQARLRDECRRAKEALSTDTDTSIPVSLPGVQTEVRLTRDELEHMIRPRINETVDALERAIRSAGVETSEVSRVLLVGGSSRTPVVAQLVRERTGRPVALDAHPKFAIATGAALLGAASTDAEPVAPVAASSSAPAALTSAVPVAGGVGGRAAGSAIAAAGVGFAATAGIAAVVGAGSAAGAATTGGAALAGTSLAGTGPAGVALGAAGPSGVAAAAGPSGVAGAAGPGGVPLPGPVAAGPAAGPVAGSGAGPVAQAANTAVRARPRLPIILGAVAGVALAAGAVVVVTSGGEPEAASTTTVTIEEEATGAVTSLPDDPSTTTIVAVTERGLAGLVELVAGNGSDNGAGVPGPAAAASLGSQARFAVAPDGDVFVAARGTVVLLVHDGTIEEIFAGDPEATEFSFGGIAVGPTGDAYVTMSRGVKRIGADGTSELVVDAQAEGLGNSFGPITVDGAGNLYFYDADTYRILRRGVDGSLSHVAGTGAQATSGPAVGDGGPAIAAPLQTPVGLVVDGRGNLLIADVGNATVRSVDRNGTITTIAGGGDVPINPSIGTYAADGTAPTDLVLGQVGGVTVDGDGRVYVSDGLSGIIVRFEGTGGIELVIADQSRSVEMVGLPAHQTRARNVGELGIDAAGDLVFYQNNTILRIVGAAR